MISKVKGLYYTSSTAHTNGERRCLAASWAPAAPEPKRGFQSGGLRTRKLGRRGAQLARARPSLASARRGAVAHTGKSYAALPLPKTEGKGAPASAASSGLLLGTAPLPNRSSAFLGFSGAEPAFEASKSSA